MTKVCAILTGTLGLMLYGCSDIAGKAHIAVFPYEDFGPQAISYELLGMGWYQWDSHGYEDPDYKYNIKVIVYDGMSLADVIRAYPTVQGQVDYRYVTKDRAVAFLNSKIAECEESARSEPDIGMASVLSVLKRTVRKIEQDWR